MGAGTGKAEAKEKSEQKNKIIKELRNFIKKNVVNLKNVNSKASKQKPNKNLPGSFVNKSRCKRQNMKSLDENINIY